MKSRAKEKPPFFLSSFLPFPSPPRSRRRPRNRSPSLPPSLPQDDESTKTVFVVAAAARRCAAPASERLLRIVNAAAAAQLLFTTLAFQRSALARSYMRGEGGSTTQLLIGSAEVTFSKKRGWRTCRLLTQRSIRYYYLPHVPIR